MRPILLLLISIFSVGILRAQEQYILSGTIHNEKNEPLEYATISLASTSNDSLYIGDITDADGHYKISVPRAGIYKLKVEYLGFLEHTEDIHIKKSSYLDVIRLREQDVVMDELVITARRKLVSNDKGKISLNVAGSELSRFASSMDIMSFLPGLIVSDNDLSVVGRGKPLLILNGKEVRNMEEIANLSPDRIKKITLDRNPSSRYDASHTSVINIETKDQLKDQLSAQLIHRSGAKRNYNHNETVSINHKKGKFTNFLSYKYGDGKNHDKVENFQNITIGNNKINNSYYSDAIEKKNEHALNLSSLIDFNEKSQLNFQYNMNVEDQNLHVSGYEKRSESKPDYLDIFRDAKSTKNYHAFSLNHLWKIDSLNQIQVFTDYIHQAYKGNENIYSKNTVQQYHNTGLLNGNSIFNTYAIRAEYATKIFKDYDVLIGARYSDIHNNAFSNFVNSDAGLSFNTSSKLQEQTAAVYGTFSKQYNLIFIEAGLRGEWNTGKYFNNDQAVLEQPRKLFNIFPSLTLSYDMSESAQLNLNYSSKISRPVFEDIDPTISYLSSALYEKGNPVLKPTIFHNISLGASFDNGLEVNGGFTYRHDLIAYAILPFNEQNNIWVNTPVNIPDSYSINANATYSKMFGKLISNLTADFSVPFIRHEFMGDRISNNKPQFQLITTNIYRLSPKVFLVGNFAMSSKYGYINTEFDPTYRLTLAVNVSLLNGKLDLSLFGNDILRKSVPNTISRYGMVESGQRLDMDTRMIGLTAKFNFNSFKNLFKPSDSSQPEIDRISK